MWMHASDDGLMEVLDGSAADRVLSHVASCGRCRARVDEARGALTKRIFLRMCVYADHD